jgi:2-polyprenyl-6-hydroxyphenyl methylase/3-demethylubiquinone-9 3-methyltransferase
MRFMILIENDIPSEKPLKILDAGCGPAGIFMILHEHCVDAIDPLLERYLQLPHFNIKNYRHVHFFCGRLEEFRKEACYDVIYCINALNHVDDIHTSLRNMFFSLKDNGICFVAVDVHNNMLLKKLFQYMPLDILHVHQFAADDYVAIFKRANWQVVKVVRLQKKIIFNYMLFVLRKA